MNLFHVAVLSLIEGVTEFLPVSSTGHLILASELLGLAQTESHKSFEIAIQLGAILAVVVFCGRTLIRDRRTASLTFVAFLPTAVAGFLLHGVVKRVLLGNIAVVIASLFLGGVILLFFEKLRPAKEETTDIPMMSVRQAFYIGLCQAVAMIPGVSRSAATIVAGEMLGVGRGAIVEFSFLLAIPTMAAATGYDLWKTAGEFTAGDVRALFTGFVLSFAFAIIAMRWFVAYVKRHSFVAFGVYRMAAAAAFLLLWK